MSSLFTLFFHHQQRKVNFTIFLCAGVLKIALHFTSALSFTRSCRWMTVALVALWLSVVYTF